MDLNGYESCMLPILNIFGISADRTGDVLHAGNTQADRTGDAAQFCNRIELSAAVSLY